MEFKDIIDFLAEKLDESDYAEVSDAINGNESMHEEYRNGAEARINEYAEGEKRMNEEIQSLKARNYDLLMQVPAGNDGDGVVMEDVDDDGTVYHIDNLFTDEKED